MIHGTEWSFFGMHFLWWFVWIAIILTAFTNYTPIPKSHLRAGERAFDILRRRYAAGQLSTEDYEQRKAVLERDEPGGSGLTQSEHLGPHGVRPRRTLTPDEGRER